MKSNFRERMRLGTDYLNYLITAKTTHGIHSPFVFDLINNVFRDKRKFYAFDEIEKVRDRLLTDGSIIHEHSHGERSKALADGTRTVNDIARVTGMPAKYGKLLFRLVNHFRPANMLELGTGLGLSTLYMSKASQDAPFLSLEGSEALSNIARNNISQQQLKNVKIIEGKFDATLPLAINELGKLHFVFIDGDHRKEPLLNYFQQCLPHVADEAIIIIDDIYWSTEMKEAWQEIIAVPEVTISLDLFRFGILFFRNGIIKQHFKIAY